MKTRALLFALTLLLSCPILQAEKTQPLIISVYITTAAPVVSPEGFVEESDKVLVDSARDLRKSLDGKDFHPKKGYPGSKSHYRVVSDPKDADIILTVAARGQNSTSLGQRTTMKIYDGVVVADTVPKVGVTRWLSVILSAGTYKKELVSWWVNQSQFSVGAWSKDAGLIAILSASWVMANEPKVLERRTALK